MDISVDPTETSVDLFQPGSHESDKKKLDENAYARGLDHSARNWI